MVALVVVRRHYAFFASMPRHHHLTVAPTTDDRACRPNPEPERSAGVADGGPICPPPVADADADSERDCGRTIAVGSTT